MNYELIKTRINEFAENVTKIISSKDTDVFRLYTLVLRSREFESFFSRINRYQIWPRSKKKWSEQHLLKQDADKQLYHFIDTIKRQISNQSKDYHNEAIRRFNERYRRDSWEFECFLEEIETEDLIGGRDAIHNFIEFCAKEWGLVFDPQVIKDLQEIDHIVIELVRRNKNGKVIFNELKSHPKSHWWWHLNELDKLSKEDLKTI